jgi:hypothetical protein
MLASASHAASPADRHAARPRARLAPAASPTARDAYRHLSRHRFGALRRRDPRRFGRGMIRMIVPAMPVVTHPYDSIRLFAHTFGAAFLFVTVFLA